MSILRWLGFMFCCMFLCVVFNSTLPLLYKAAAVVGILAGLTGGKSCR